VNLKKENTTLRILLKTISELNLSFERKNISNIVVEGLQKFLNLDSSFFYSLDEKKGFFMLEASSGNDEEKDVIPMGYGFVGWVGRSGEILAVSDTDKGENNLIIAPVKGKRGLLGVIGGRKKGMPFSDNEKELLNLFATQVGTAMENYIYYHRLQRGKDFRDCILYNIPSGIIIVNPDWKVKTYNQSAITILGEKNIARGKKIYQIFQNDLIIKAVKETFSGKGPFRNLEVTHNKSFFNVTVVPVKGMALDGDDVMIVFDDITELRKVYQEKERAERLSNLGQFAAAIAHELRNPITGINIMLEMLKDSPSLSEKQIATIDKILSEINQLEEMVKSMLEISKPQDLKLERVDLEEVVNTFVEAVKGMAKKRNVIIEVEVKNKNIVADIDRKKINQVFLNLFNNSLDSMKNGGRFSIRLKKAGRYAEIEVEDTGCGIPKGSLDKIFEPFFTTKHTGTGLGLHISKNIINQHHGKLTVESDGKSWTRFVIHLPSGVKNI